MIHKKYQRRKIQGSKKENRRQTKKETEGEKESRGYAKKDRGERQKVEDGKVEHRKRKRQKRIGSEKTKKKNICFILSIIINKGKKGENDRTEACTKYLCWGYIFKRPK